jgi:porin
MLQTRVTSAGGVRGVVVGRVSAAMLVLACGVASSTAWGQQELPEAASSTGDELVGVPTDLPGHEEGPRSRKKDEEAAKPEGEAKLAGEAGAEPETFAPNDGPWWTWDRATGNWWGARDRLEKGGLTIAGSYTGEWTAVFAGGVDTGSTYRHLLDVNATLDLGTVFGLEGGSVFIDFYSTSGHGAVNDIGAVIPSSDLEVGDNRDQLAELWYQQWLFDRVLRIKVGKIDANSEFALPDADSEFTHTTAVISSTLQGITTYPDPATGALAFVYPTDWLYFGAGFFDGATLDGISTGTRGPATFFSDDRSSSWSIIGEAGVTAEELGFLRGAKLALGGWGHTADFARFDGGADEEGTAGFYALASSYVWKHEASDAEDRRGVEVLLQYGWADEDVAVSAHHFGAGVQWHGPFEARRDDSTGLYVTHTDFSDEPGAAESDGETTLEWYYEVQLTPFVSVKPDLQFYFNPGGDARADDAAVFALRVEVVF